MRNIHLSYLPRAAAVDPGYRHGDGHRAVRRSRGEHVELVPLAVEHVDELAPPRPPATARRTGSPRCPATPRRWPTTSGGCWRSRDAGAAVPFAQRRLADGRLVGCTRFMELRWWRGRDEPDEVEIGGTWLAADAQRSADQHRGQAAPADPRLRAVGRRARRPGHRLAATSAAGRRSSASAPASRASLRHHRPSTGRGRGRPAARHGAVRDHRRRLAGGARAAGTAPAIAYRRRLMADRMRPCDVLIVTAHPARTASTTPSAEAAERGLPQRRPRRHDARPLRHRVRAGDVGGRARRPTTAISR